MVDDDPKKGGQGELLAMGRLVPVRREGNKVYARTLLPEEEDTGETVNLQPGDQLIIPAGGFVIDSGAIDAESVKGLGGYAPVANTVWTWYNIVGEELGFFLFVFSLARRIDAAHTLWALAIEERERSETEGAIPRRAGFFNALATAEVAIIALHRGIAMIDALVDKYCPDLETPESVRRIQATVQDMRHAFEHIDERATGRVGMSGRVEAEALSIFDQPDFIQSSVLSYKGHTLDFNEGVLKALLDCRELVLKTIDSRAHPRREQRGVDEADAQHPRTDQEPH